MGNSGIFGYVNYLVEKDRKTIIDTLVNGGFSRDSLGSNKSHDKRNQLTHSRSRTS